MNVKKKCVAILAIVIAAMAAWGIVVTVKCAGQEQPGFNDDKVKLITHQQYIDDAGSQRNLCRERELDCGWKRRGLHRRL